MEWLIIQMWMEMRNIMNNYIINKEDTFENLLSKEHYFQSLLQVLYSNDLLSTKDIESIQLQILDLLKETVNYYTKAESYSVKEEIAEQLMLSIYYTIGIFLKDIPTIKERITSIKESAMKYLFSEGEKILKTKVEESKELLKLVQKNRLNTANYAYIDTIGYGIPLFFIDYDIRFASHETPGSIDYPLAIDEMDLVGIEYINEYLNKINFENKFCSYFENAEIEALLNGFDKNSDHLLINIFELVFTNYLGRMLLGRAGRHLEITELDRYYLKSKIEKLKHEELYMLISEEVKKMCNDFSIKDDYFISYLNKTGIKIISEIKGNIELNKLANIFITLNNSKDNLVKYKDGEAMNDSKFRIITEEIRACRNVEDKIKIIREEINSLEDLVDVLSSDCIFDDEFIDVFKVLDDFEIALLLKYISNDSAVDRDYGTEGEKEWHRKLQNYLSDLEEVKKEEIIKISKGIDI